MPKQKNPILVIDDDSDVLLSTRLFLKQHFEDIHTESNPKKINELLSQYTFDIVLLDMNFRKGEQDGAEGLYWLRHIKSISSSTAVIMITAYGNIELAVEAVRCGAVDFVLKPWNGEKILNAIDKGLSTISGKRKPVKKNLSTTESSFIGQSEPIKDLLNSIEKIAQTDANVLILGENGTGKQLVANIIHEKSLRNQNTLNSVDLGSLSGTLFESELFGHAAGAFTDAKESKPGRFELADKSTIFLDEIGNVPIHLQSKLLTVIQQRSVTRVGEAKPKDIDVRIISATNSNLQEMVNKGEFRQDLLYRINTIELTIPPLRNRKEDIPLLIEFFMNKFKKKYRKDYVDIAESAITKMCKYRWPGNIRELEHCIERMLILCDGNQITPDDFTLSPSLLTESNTELDSLNLEEMERMCVTKAVDKHKGNISKAAEELGLTRAALYRRIEKYGI